MRMGNAELCCRGARDDELCCCRRQLTPGDAKDDRQKTRRVRLAMAELPEAATMEGRSISSASAAGESSAPHKAEKRNREAMQKLRVVEAAADKLRGCCRKFPKGATGWKKTSLMAKERFFAVVPKKFEAKTYSSSQQLRHWRDGSLCYWQSEGSFHKQELPKGEVPLLSITKIFISENNSTEVTVTFAKEGQADRAQLQLQFPSGTRAEQWRQDMRQLRATL
eukprot:TRINITY_DN16351_c0_g1_i2.p1 TRINITY_DN16351_c0_g1~~TRINITY_DN16351_c0_g1_i2.p1  ORF type:complete len:223 (-),score=59.76 TRINITY_DN16351_c0_g1_i2:63-731(-)